MFQPGGPSFLELARQCLSSTRRGYDLLAPKFDRTPFRTPDPVLEVFGRHLSPCQHALDLCCGTGAVLEVLRPLVSDRLVGVDFSPGMLTVCRDNLSRHPGPAQLELQEQDCLQLGFVGEFDLVTCSGSFGHILPEQEPRFVRCIARALRPGGRFVFVSSFWPRRGSDRWWRCQLFNLAMRVRNLLVRPPFIMYFLTFLLPETIGMLEAHGFSVEIRRGLFDTCGTPGPANEWSDLVLVEATLTSRGPL